jgi:hypothetical protein
MRTSEILYLELLSSSYTHLKKFLDKFPLYETQLTYDKEFNSDCFTKMYESQRGSAHKRRQEFWPIIPQLKQVCGKCWKFYLNPRNNSIKHLDIKFGKEFERVFSDFLHNKGFRCEKGDAEGKNYPDLVILNEAGKKVCYLELKYLAAPFLMVHKHVVGRECYEGSTTLDVGRKIEAQRKIVEEVIHIPVFYVYWIDYPCIKGVFYMESKDVYQYIDSVQGVQFTRRDRRGDYVKTLGGKQKISQLDKVYLPLLRMGDFSELLNRMTILVGGQLG